MALQKIRHFVEKASHISKAPFEGLFRQGGTKRLWGVGFEMTMGNHRIYVHATQKKALNGLNG